MKKLWEISRKMWAGKTAIVLASGPSLKSVLPAIRCVVGDGRYVTIAVNSTGIDTESGGVQSPAAAPWADVLYAADSRWWLVNAQRALAHPGIKASADQTPFKAVRHLIPTGQTGFDPTPGCIRTGGNSAYQAMHIAAQAGASKILLCGVDMHSRDGSHHHGDHPSPLRNPEPGSFAAFKRHFATFPYAELGIEVLNCSPTSDLMCFPKVDIEEALS